LLRLKTSQAVLEPVLCNEVLSV